MFRGVVEAALGSQEIALVKITFAELAIRYGQPFLVADRAMVIKGLFERCDSLVPLAGTGFLEGKVGIEDAKTTIVFQLMQKIQGFEIVGACPR